MTASSLPIVRVTRGNSVATHSKAKRLLFRAAGLVLAPLNWAYAHALGTPGLAFHRKCSALSLRLLLANPRSVPGRWVAHTLLAPIVLTRYFEFDYAWRQLLETSATRYLDVSSPSMFPLLLMAQKRAQQALLINPDSSDLELTRKFVNDLRIGDTCETSSALVGDLDLPDEHFDLITSLSVVEHIPKNREAIARLWRMLKPGGRLVLTLPCAARAYELHTNFDSYGLLGLDAQGFSFLEYVYDSALLETNIFSVTGQPAHLEVYGERRAGELREAIVSRWQGDYWRFWEEPVFMGRHFKDFASIEALPGEGVVGLTFIKP